MPKKNRKNNNYEDLTTKELVKLCITILGEKGLNYPAELAERSHLTVKKGLRETVIDIIKE